MILALILSGCGETYVQREQIKEGLTLSQIKSLNAKSGTYTCRKLYETKDSEVYRLFLTDENRNIRPYKLSFSHDGILQSMSLDTSYEDSQIETAGSFIKSRGDKRDEERLYWEKP